MGEGPCMRKERARPPSLAMGGLSAVLWTMTKFYKKIIGMILMQRI